MKIALNMFTVRNAMAKDPDATLRALAEMGYNYIETYPDYDFTTMAPKNYGLHKPAWTAREEKKFLDEIGIKIFGYHIADSILDNQKWLEDHINYNAELGTENFGFQGTFYSSLEQLKERCERYNEAGKLCHEKGMRFHYHNHYNEFQKFNGKYHLDYIMEYTDPNLVDFELDTYWAMRGGVDYIACIEKYKDRLVMIHQKDFPKDFYEHINLFDGIYDINASLGFDTLLNSNPEAFVEIGDGLMDIQKVINEGNRVGCPAIQVEQDHSKFSELECCRINLENLKKYDGIEA